MRRGDDAGGGSGDWRTQQGFGKDMIWLADVLARIAGHPVHRLDELLPWNWRGPSAQAGQAA